MDPVTDHLRIAPYRRASFALGLALGLVATASGCSRLQSFRRTDRPAFGTDTVSAESPRPTGGSEPSSVSGDLYADRLGKSKGPGVSSPSPSEAPRTPTLVSDGSGVPLPDRDDHPAIALQPPEPLRNANATLASRQPPAPAFPATASEPLAVEPGPQAVAADAPGTVGTGANLASVIAESRRRLESLSNYRVQMSHQERVGGTLNPAENVVLSVRRAPKAVRLEWREGPNQGRDVLYSSESHGGLLHVKMPNPLIPRLSMPPDSPLAARSSRHPITEAGFDTIVHNIELSEQAQSAGDTSTRGRIRYEGLGRADGLSAPCHKIVRVTPTGETWLIYLDAATSLPALVQATAQNGELLERYVYSDVTTDLPELAQADAFDPDARWGPAKGLFGRIARGGSSESKETQTR